MRLATAILVPTALLDGARRLRFLLNHGKPIFGLLERSRKAHIWDDDVLETVVLDLRFLGLLFFLFFYLEMLYRAGFMLRYVDLLVRLLLHGFTTTVSIRWRHHLIIL